jgi:hypothetical protein
VRREESKAYKKPVAIDAKLWYNERVMSKAKSAETGF